jgi:Asp-tRNA(Asn)/Glu-tRNA(Gln) amidotransferase A subunit family amidase
MVFNMPASSRHRFTAKSIMRIEEADFSVHTITSHVHARADAPWAAAQRALQRIKDQDTDLRAWSFVASEQALLAATDDINIDGPLAGVPVGVKDVIDVAGMPTRCGSDASREISVQFDACCVGILRAAGAIPIGKTVTAEFAFKAPGPTRNPHDDRHTPGGSSSGSAAAVAAGMVPVALSTQTGGSIIRPAAFCGVIGFKPSYGAVFRDGMKITCESLDVIGWHGRSIKDAAAVARVLLPFEGPMVTAAGTPPIQVGGLKVAIMSENPSEAVDLDGRSALAHARRALMNQGAVCGDVTLAREASLLMQAHQTIMEYEFARSLAPVVRRHAPVLSRSLLETVSRGLAIPASRYREMLHAQRQLRGAWNEMFQDADLILTPSTPGAAPIGLEHTGSAAFNKIWSVLGWPCLHLPLGAASNGLPVGVQLVANWEADFELLAWGDYLHDILKFKGETNEY